MIDAILELCARFIHGFIVDVLLVGIFYWPGWLSLRIVTFGRYPPSRHQPHHVEFVAGMGLVAFLAGITLYFT